jgi:hypothetical protein
MTEYQWIRAVISLLGVIAWPTLVGALAFAFRRPLRSLLENVKKVTAGPVSVDIEKGLAETTQSFVQLVEDSGSEDAEEASLAIQSPLGEFNAQRADEAAEPPSPLRPIPLRDYYASNAEENPKSAIILAYIALEKWYDFALRSHGLPIYDGTQRRGVRKMSRVAVEEGMLPASSIDTVEGLSLMRDLVVDKPGEEVSSQQGREFLVLTDGVMYTPTTELKKYEKDHPPLDVEQPFNY